MVASLVSENRPQVHRLPWLWSTGMGDLPGPGVKPMSPALAGGLTTGPPGMSPSETYSYN